MRTEDHSFTTNDGLKIYAKHWGIDAPKALICLVHGLFEHCNRYDKYARSFNENGYAVLGYDRRGHGHSEGKRGHTPSFEAYLQEVDQLINLGKKLYANVPIILYGHSQGGNIVLNYIIDRKPKVKLVIATSPWIILANNPPAILLSLLGLLNRLLPTFNAPNDLDAKAISSIESEVKKYVEDPMVHRAVTFRTGAEMLKSANKLLNFNGDFPVPLLLMHGDSDRVVAPESSIGFAERAKGNIELKIWEGQFHEIHNDTKSKEMFEHAVEWLNNNL